MSLTVPLAARLYNTKVDRHVTRDVESLSFRSAVPGGFASATIRFSEPVSVGDATTSQFTHVQISDTRTAEVVWQGRIEDPTPTVGTNVQVWEITAMGPAARAQDQTVPRVYIETSLEGWFQSNKQSPSATTEVGATPDGNHDESLVLAVPGGSVIGNGVTAALYYERLADCGQEIGGYSATRIAGKTPGVASDWKNETFVVARDGTPSNTNVSTGNFSTAPVVIGPVVVVTDFPAAADILRYQLLRSNGATTVADDLTWGALYNVYVAARRKDKTGAFVTNADHANAFVLASEVVADLLGSGLLPYDGPNASIATTTHHIDQMVYIDGATPFEILDDLMALENAYYWAAWEGDLPRFEWTAWPTTVSYEVSIDDGYEAPSSSVELFSQVLVRWKNKRGRIVTSTYTATVGTLVDAGIVRQGFVDLSDEAGSQANADRVGANFLADHAFPPNAGTITIARPIVNLVTGRLENPWQIRPGRLVRVRGVDPNPDALNATDRDGVTVMRIIATQYDAERNAAVGELDSYSQALARSLKRAGERNRRR